MESIAASAIPDNKSSRYHRVWAIERRDGEEVARFDSRQVAVASARELRQYTGQRYRVVSYAEAR